MPTSDPVEKRALAATNAVLDEFFAANIADAQAISSHYGLLWRELQRLLQAGGKRLRPRMLLLSYTAYGGQDFAAVGPLAAATELLHLSMLIHDDIIDRDTVRYGAKNISGRYLEHYKPLLKQPAERRHFADSAALLAGDALLAGAYQLISSASLKPDVKASATKIFSRSIFEIIGGELADTEATFRGEDKVMPLDIARYKTASYTVISPLVLGAAAAGAPAIELTRLQNFGEKLGVAFQLRDDILGLFGDSAATGKSTTSDLREGKQTYLVELFLSRAGRAERQTFDEYFGKPDINDQHADKVRDVLVSSGALSDTEIKIAELHRQALKILSSLHLSPEYQTKFRDISDKAVRRDY
jgi:geranylgeranyl pyrophosphate synthase